MSSSSRMTSISLGDEEILERLGFGEGEIEMLEFKNVPINKIRKEYKNSLNGYGISGISLRQIMDANELKDLIQTDIDIEKKDVANDVFHNINNEMDRGQGVKRKTKRKTIRRKTIRKKRRTNKRK